MASLPILTVLERYNVSPPPATVANGSLPLSFFDIFWLRFPPAHHLIFYDHPTVTKTYFKETIVPNLKKSLSITLQHFFPYAGNLIVFPTPTRKPEIRYLDGDSVALTIAESSLDFNDLTGNHPRDCGNLIVFPTPTRKPEIRYLDGDSVALTIAESSLDFNDLTGNHPRDCGKFYHLIPLFLEAVKESDHIKIPVFSIQVTFFPNFGISIGMTTHHCLGDAITQFSFLEAWTSVARSGTDESFLANGTLPVLDRVVKYPKIDEIYLKNTKVETFDEKYQHQRLSEPTDKVRATFILTRTVINRLKKWVSTQLPTLPYVSSFTVACGYIWSCLAKSRNDELKVFIFAIDCRGRIDPPIPAAYFGNCVVPCVSIAKTNLLTGNEGFLNATKLLGENLHKMLTDKDGVVKEISPLEGLFSQGKPMTKMGVSGTPKVKFYDIDFGWGKPRKNEIISLDYNNSISLSACKESNEDMEIGVCLSTTMMEAFVTIFKEGLETHTS